MDIKCSSIRWIEDGDGDWLCLMTDDAKAAACELQGGEWDVKIVPHRKKRSLSANAYAWVLIDKIAKKTGIKKDDVYRNAVRNVGGNIDIVCVQARAVDSLRRNWERNGIGWMTETLDSKIDGCVNVILYAGSSVYDTHQMTRLIGGLVQDCRALDIETMPDNQLMSLLGEWDARENKITTN